MNRFLRATKVLKSLGLAALGMSLTLVFTQDSFANKEGARERARREAKKQIEREERPEKIAERTAARIQDLVTDAALLGSMGGKESLKTAFTQTGKEMAAAAKDSAREANGLAVMHEMANKLRSIDGPLKEHVSIIMSANAYMKQRTGSWMIHPENLGELLGEAMGISVRFTESDVVKEFSAGKDLTQIAEWRKLAELVLAVDAEVNKDMVEGQPVMTADQIRDAVIELAFVGDVSRLIVAGGKFRQLVEGKEDLRGRILSLKLSDKLIGERSATDLQQLLRLVVECTQS